MTDEEYFSYLAPKRHTEQAKRYVREVVKVGDWRYVTESLTYDKGESLWARYNDDGEWHLIKRNDELWIDCIPGKSRACSWCLNLLSCEPPYCKYRSIGGILEVQHGEWRAYMGEWAKSLMTSKHWGYGDGGAYD